MSAELRLKELGLELPPVPEAAGNYRHALRCGGQLFLSAKAHPGTTGKVSSEVGIEDAYQAARQTGLILLAVLQQELGSLDKVVQVAKLTGSVNADPEFADHPQVINGCSDLLVEVFGARGRHARSAIGVGSTPGRVSVVIDLVVEVE